MRSVWNKMQNHSRYRILQTYEADTKRHDRINTQWCKCCTYLDSHLAGQAFTNFTCKQCGKEYTHPNTDVNMYCYECAVKLDICKHCGSPMD